MSGAAYAREQQSPLTFDNVSVRYAGRPTLALDHVSVVAEPGKMTAVVGPNGSGKSTLVRTLLRRVALQSGRVTVGGVDVASLDAREVARRIAIVPQREEPVLPLRVEEFVALGRHARRSAFGGMSADDHAAVNSAIARAPLMPAAACRGCMVKSSKKGGLAM